MKTTKKLAARDGFRPSKKRICRRRRAKRSGGTLGVNETSRRTLTENDVRESWKRAREKQNIRRTRRTVHRIPSASAESKWEPFCF